MQRAGVRLSQTMTALTRVTQALTDTAKTSTGAGLLAMIKVVARTRLWSGTFNKIYQLYDQ